MDKKLREPIYVTLGEISMQNMSSGTVGKESDAAPNPGPVPALIPAPILAPTQAPILLLTPAPILAPTQAPILALTPAPIPAPTQAPILALTPAPTQVPIPSLTQEPAQAPIPAPTPAPTEDTSDPQNTADADGSGNDNDSSRSRKLVGFDRCSLYFLFYVSVIQPFIKTVTCATVISLDIKLDNSCGSNCYKPMYSQDRAIYFIGSLVLCGLSITHFCLGIWLFTKYRSLTKDTLQGPMLGCAIILCAEVFILVLAAVVTNVTIEILIGCAVIITTELIAVLTAFCYPKTYCTALNELAARRIAHTNEDRV